MGTEKKTWGILAAFETPQTIYTACESVRDEGFRHWDALTPFPVHGLDRAMGVPPSKVPWIVLGMAIFGMLAGFTIQWWTTAVDYPIMIAGKPFFSWPAWIPGWKNWRPRWGFNRTSRVWNCWRRGRRTSSKRKTCGRRARARPRPGSALFR